MQRAVMFCACVATAAGVAAAQAVECPTTLRFDDDTAGLTNGRINTEMTHAGRGAFEITSAETGRLALNEARPRHVIWRVLLPSEQAELVMVLGDGSQERSLEVSVAYQQGPGTTLWNGGVTLYLRAGQGERRVAGRMAVGSFVDIKLAFSWDTEQLVLQTTQGGASIWLPIGLKHLSEVTIGGTTGVLVDEMWFDCPEDPVELPCRTALHFDTDADAAGLVNGRINTATPHAGRGAFEITEAGQTGRVHFDGVLPKRVDLYVRLPTAESNVTVALGDGSHFVELRVVGDGSPRATVLAGAQEVGRMAVGVYERLLFAINFESMLASLEFRGSGWTPVTPPSGLQHLSEVAITGTAGVLVDEVGFACDSHYVRVYIDTGNGRWDASGSRFTVEIEGDGHRTVRQTGVVGAARGETRELLFHGTIVPEDVTAVVIRAEAGSVDGWGVRRVFVKRSASNSSRRLRAVGLLRQQKAFVKDIRGKREYRFE